MICAHEHLNPDGAAAPEPGDGLVAPWPDVRRLCPSRPMMSEDERQLVTDELFWESGELTAHLARFFVLIVLLTR